MPELLVGVTLVGGLIALGIALTRRRARLLALDRLDEVLDDRDPTVVVPRRDRRQGALPVRRRTWLPWAVAGVTALIAAIALRWNPAFVVGFAALSGILASMVERLRVDRLIGRLETQLADAIDIIASGIRAGSSLLTAIESATTELDPPLGPVLARVGERLRLGEGAVHALAGLQQRVPIETVQMFGLSVAVNLEAGGSLGPVLEGLAKTVRQRLEVTQRIRAQSVQSRLSVLAIMLITYSIAVAMWWINPERTEGFLASDIGGWLVGGAILLQALGLSWMERLSRVEF